MTMKKMPTLIQLLALSFSIAITTTSASPTAYQEPSLFAYSDASISPAISYDEESVNDPSLTIGFESNSIWGPTTTMATTTT